MDFPVPTLDGPLTARREMNAPWTGGVECFKEDVVEAKRSEKSLVHMEHHTFRPTRLLVPSALLLEYTIDS